LTDYIPQTAKINSFRDPYPHPKAIKVVFLFVYHLLVRKDYQNVSSKSRPILFHAMAYILTDRRIMSPPCGASMEAANLIEFRIL